MRKVMASYFFFCRVVCGVLLCAGYFLVAGPVLVPRRTSREQKAFLGVLCMDVHYTWRCIIQMAQLHPSLWSLPSPPLNLGRPCDALGFRMCEAPLCQRAAPAGDQGAGGERKGVPAPLPPALAALPPSSKHYHPQKKHFSLAISPEGGVLGRFPEAEGERWGSEWMLCISKCSRNSMGGGQRDKKGKEAQ